jgi:hypothetical protein
MYAAALGRLDTVRALAGAGADVNDLAWHGFGRDLPGLPFLDSLLESGAIKAAGMTALGYAAGYGREGVVEFLGPRTTAELRRDAEAVVRARRDYLGGLDDKARAAFLRKLDRPVSGAPEARRALVAEHPKVSRWIVRCGLCGREGYKPTMPAEIDRQGTAARVRRLFRPLALENYFCERCRGKTGKARRQAEALFQKRLAELPPHVKVEVVQPKPTKRRPAEDA